MYYSTLSCSYVEFSDIGLYLTLSRIDVGSYSKKGRIRRRVVFDVGYF
jgi:hypothetical protein